jgi:uncharacterized protein with NAD-binding domain and iron-sulfur cluster
MPKKVAILGGGVAGLSAAHHLCTKGFEVHVYERNPDLGGKARSFDVDGSGTAGRPNLPAEHGFRFFPAFYWHLPQTMKEIPVGRNRWVAGNLVHGTLMQLARGHGQSEVFVPAGFPRSPAELYRSIAFLFGYSNRLGLDPIDVWHFVRRLVVLMSSSEERWIGEWEHMSWWEFSEAEGRSPEYQKYLADGMTRIMVAARAKEMSARTGGSITLQLLYGLSKPGPSFDRLLNAPTSMAWIEPWRTHLERKGVTFHLGATLTGFNCSNGKIARVTIHKDGADHPVEADYFVAALPAEKLRPLITNPMKALDPALARLTHLKTSWMNGVMFYLKKDVRIVYGHSLYSDSEWALSSISQQQFWPRVRLSQMGDGTVNGVLSVDVSDWSTPGSQGKSAKNSTAAEVRREVWKQLKDHLNNEPVAETLQDNNLWGTGFLDPAISFAPGGATNDEELLINTKGSWDNRPNAKTQIPNLFLAADYVRTFTDLATMEGANEAARRAVNGILTAEHRPAREHCKLKPLWQPPVFKMARILDGWRYHSHLPHHVDELVPAMPPDFAARPDLALGRFEKQVNDPQGVVVPANWPDAPPQLPPRAPHEPRPLDPMLPRPGDPPRPSWIREAARPPGR